MPPSNKEVENGMLNNVLIFITEISKAQHSDFL